jgi:CheY-like chemotaxis protein
MLESIGIRTEPANNAQEAIQILLTGVKFDFIFVDFDLSIINGPEVSPIFYFPFFILLITFVTL